MQDCYWNTFFVCRKRFVGITFLRTVFTFFPGTIKNEKYFKETLRPPFPICRAN